MDKGRVYVGFITKKSDNSYFVEFPELPGCITFGWSLEEAMAMGVDALLTYLEVEEVPFKLEYAA